MAIAYGNGANLGAGSGGTLTASFTTAGANILLAVACLGAAGDNISDVKFNGVSLTKVVTGNSLGRYLYIWIYQNAPATTANIVITTTGSTDIRAAVADYWTGVATTGQPEDTSVVGGGSSPRAIVVDTVTDNSWGIAAARAFDPPSVGAGSGTTLRHGYTADPFIAILDSGGPKTPAGALTLNATGAGGVEVIAIAVAPAAGGTTIDADGSSSGAATVSGAGGALASADGSTAAAATVSGAGGALASAAGSAAGTATAMAAGGALASAAGILAGTATVSAVSEAGAVISADGTAAGVATVAGVGASLAASAGTLTGRATVTGRAAGADTSSDTSDIDAALLARLDADDQLAELLPDGVYWESAPQHATAFVVVTQETHDDRQSLSAPEPAVEELRYIVLAVHQDESGQTTKAAAARIRALLEDAEDDPVAPLTVDGYSILALKRARRLRDRFIDDSTQLPWEYRGGIYEIWAAPV